MKITKLPLPVDPTDAIVKAVLDMPIHAFAMAHGDVYRIGSHGAVDLLQRTGISGFVNGGAVAHSTGLDEHKVYYNQAEAKQWVRQHLKSGAEITIFDPNDEEA
jgi:hypothetical protein